MILQASNSSHSKRPFNWQAAGSFVSLGYAWSMQFPIIKKIWTSSLCWWPGDSFLLLALFYYVSTAWAFITGAGLCMDWHEPHHHLSGACFSADNLANRLVGGPIKGVGNYGEVLVLAVVLAMSFGLVWFLHRRKIYLRV